MAIPPNMLAQFAQDPSLTPEAAMMDRAAQTVYQAPEEGEKYEDVLLDGWGYRSYGDGKIKIIVAPEGHKAGAVLTGGPAYEAIRGEIDRSKAPPPLPAPAAAPTDLPPAAGVPSGSTMQQAIEAWRKGPAGTPTTGG